MEKREKKEDNGEAREWKEDNERRGKNRERVYSTVLRQRFCADVYLFAKQYYTSFGD